jgi:tetratricopeptide (TPR) repeat protein
MTDEKNNQISITKERCQHCREGFVEPMFPPTFISDPNTDKNSITVAIIESPGPCRHCGGLGLISRGDAFQDARRRMLSQYDEYQRVLQPLSSTPFPPGIALEHLDQFEKTAQNFHETYGEPSEQSFVRTLLERTLKQIRAELHLQVSELVTKLRRAIQLQPHNAIPYQAFISAYEGDHIQAEQQLIAWANQHPNSNKAWFDLGSFYTIFKRDFSTARTYIIRSASVGNPKALHYWKAAECASIEGNEPLAQELYAKAFHSSSFAELPKPAQDEIRRILNAIPKTHT